MMAQRKKNENSSSSDYQIRLLVDFANMHEGGGASWFWQKWQREFWPETPESLLQLRNELREIWDLETRTNLSSNQERQEEDVLNRWLAWRPTPEEEQSKNRAKVRLHEEEYRKTSHATLSPIDAAGPLLERVRALRERLPLIQELEQESLETRTETIAEFDDVLEAAGQATDRFVALRPQLEKLLKKEFEKGLAAALGLGYLPFRCSISEKGFVPDPKNIRAVLILAVIQNHGRMRYCANPDCASPYFVAKRRDQTVCDAGACKAERQRLHALKWWRENRSTKGSVQPKMNVVSRKVRKDHGTCKTR